MVEYKGTHHEKEKVQELEIILTIPAQLQKNVPLDTNPDEDVLLLCFCGWSLGKIHFEVEGVGKAN